ncbi:MAG: hypothetical protein J7M21_03150, partial [Planctomycetes bacterium]|nr:hypothetical protein [Planctomycetota bacterium]
MAIFAVLMGGPCPPRAAGGANRRSAEPVGYVRRATWYETMIASRQAMARMDSAAAPAGGKALAPTAIELGGRHRSAKLDVNIAGVKTLYIAAASADGSEITLNNCRLTAKDGRSQLLMVNKPPVARKACRGSIRQSVRGDRVSLRLQNAEVVMQLDGRWDRLEGTVGVRPRSAVGWAACRVADRPVLDRCRRKVLARELLWQAVMRDFAAAPKESWQERADGIWLNWKPGDLATLAQRYAAMTDRQARTLAKTARSIADLAAIRRLYWRSKDSKELASTLQEVKPEAIRRAIRDLMETFPKRYTRGEEFLRRLAPLAEQLPAIISGVTKGDESAIRKAKELLALRREALLSNPLLDFDKLLVVRRGLNNLGLPRNWLSNSSISKNGYDNEIDVLSPIGPDGRLRTLFRPDGGYFVGDVDLDFDARRMLFSMATKDNWGLFEIRADGSGLKRLTPAEPKDVDSYDGCYLPDGRIMFTSTANYQGVPCIGGHGHVANLALLDRKTGRVRMVGFEQDHDWCPTVVNDGRVMYLRWEYTDTPHFYTRLIFTMNPDGTNQRSLYGSNSYWPNALFFARPIPNDPTKFVGIVGGHHDVPRMGELVIFDPAKGSYQADGVVQRIPGYGKEVPPIIRDGLAGPTWPHFLHPWPLSEKYFLVSRQVGRSSSSPWGIYLVDVFDNMVPIKILPGYALLEPVPFKPRPRPPVIPDKVDLTRKDAIVYVMDVYKGPGPAGIPRGTVKRLRLFTYSFGYRGMGGHNCFGVESGWDSKQILGTVPVEPDGSAMFRVPANTPISIQPLDANGAALQLMR